MEKRYKAYLEKARSIIRTLDNNKKSSSDSTNANNIHQITKLKAELANKTKIIQRLETEHQKNRENRSDEERLLVNAWHRLTQNNQFKTVQNSVNNRNMGQQGQQAAHNILLNAANNSHLPGSYSANGNISSGSTTGSAASGPAGHQPNHIINVTTPRRENINGQSFLSKQRQTANKRFQPKFQANGMEPNSNFGHPNQNMQGQMGQNGQKGKSWLMGSWTYF